MNETNNWLLNCPKPVCGQLAPNYYNAGPMLADDRNGATSEDSRMQVCIRLSSISIACTMIPKIMLLIKQ